MTTEIEDRFIPVADGLKLHARIHGGSNPGTPVLCLPGLTRNLLDFDQLARGLAATHGRRVISLSARGRGLSDRDPEPSRYTVPVETTDVLAVMNALSIDHAAFVGTSRGGLILHVMAMMEPDRITRAVLNDIGPVLETDGLRQIQSQLGARQAPESLAEAATVLQRAYGAEFPDLADQDWQDMAQALYREQDGKLGSDYDPAIAAQFAAFDLDTPLPALWDAFDRLAEKPVMVIRGENSRLLSSRTVTAMAEHKQDLVAIEARGQGHAPILHIPPLADAIAAFLRD